MAVKFLHQKLNIPAMQCCVIKIIVVCVLVRSHLVSSNVEPSSSSSQDILMKGAKPKKAEEYIHVAYPVLEDKLFIYKFEAIANADTVHHMILYGCKDEAFSTDKIWEYSLACKGPQSILFAWAKNAPPTVLPKGVGVRIGKTTTVKILVLQVHYARAFKEDEKEDYSGVRIFTTHEEQPFVAGIYLLVGDGFLIPPGIPSYPVDISCTFKMEKSIFPFAYKTHAHSLGAVITGYAHNGTHWLVGKGNPQWSQSFYPVLNKDIEIKPGSSLAARCTYNSTSMTHSVSFGSTGMDEMCNFFMMFYTDSSVKDPSGTCTGNNIPEITGDNFPSDVSIPLPPNPALEEKAKGSHHHSSMTGSPDQEEQNVNTFEDTWTMDLLMKGAMPNKPDSYLCAAYSVAEPEVYIYKFQALANVSTVHHILVYGCDGEPFSNEPFWQCPLMCKSFESTILFAWAKNAPPTVLPKDVGLRIGQKSTIKTIVLQVHYARVFAADEKPDTSGIRVYVTHQKQPYVAGIFFLGSSSFSIPPGEPSFPVEVSCRFPMKKSIFPFAFRPHAHGLGRVITGYLFNGTYFQLGKGNPQWPQAFYPVTNKVEVKPGNYLAARCTYDSTSMDKEVSVGSTGNDEMCNFYIMFYTDNSVVKPSGQCNGNDESWLTGDNFPKDVSVPLPPNPALEESAKGHHHNHHESSGSETPVHFNQPLMLNSTWPGENIVFGQIGGIATDIDGNVYIFHRGSRIWDVGSFSSDNTFSYQDTPIPEDVIVILNSSGHLIHKFGAGEYYMPHGIEVDQYKNIWITDVALHQVFKIQAGRAQPTLTLGKKFQPGNGVSTFCKPTDIAVLPSGEFFVSDGYCNSRVLKFSKDGALKQIWGEKSLFPVIPSPVTFIIPHSISVSEENELVCVADRENGQIQCFDLNGNFKHIIKHPEFGTRLFAIEQSPLYGGVLYAVNGPPLSPSSSISVQGFTLDIKTGTILEIWNIPQHLKNPHDVCVHTESQSVYVGELNPKAVWKLYRPKLEDKPEHVHLPKNNDVVIHEESAIITTTSVTSNKSVQKPDADELLSISSNGEKSLENNSNDFLIPIVVGCLLVVPVIIILIVILVKRAHTTGGLMCCRKRQSFSLKGVVGNSYKGFEPIKTEESDHDSDCQEYISPKKIKNGT